MNQKEAKLMLDRGAEVTHPFLDGGFVRVVDGELADQNGHVQFMFFESRPNEHWQKDWEVLIPIPPKKDKSKNKKR